MYDYKPIIGSDILNMNHRNALHTNVLAYSPELGVKMISVMELQCSCEEIEEGEWPLYTLWAEVPQPTEEQIEAVGEKEEKCIARTLKELSDNYDWDKVCSVLGFSHYCLNEGADGNDVVMMTPTQARKIGVI